MGGIGELMACLAKLLKSAHIFECFSKMYFWRETVCVWPIHLKHTFGEEQFDVLAKLFKNASKCFSQKGFSKKYLRGEARQKRDDSWALMCFLMERLFSRMCLLLITSRPMRSTL